jgi:predicted ribosome quality control (RQC) complex YloA/Tae2 family protein
MVNFRKFITSSGKLVLGGKSAENNEQLVAQIDPKEIVLHTKSPGSPFTNIKIKDNEKTSKGDIEEAAVFCARYSQDYRDNKKDVVVHYFMGKDIYKEEGMKPGTFGVKKCKELNVKKEEIEKFENK